MELELNLENVETMVPLIYQCRSYIFVMQVRTTPKTTLPNDSFVDLLHPEHNTEVMGKERLGKACAMKGGARAMYADGAQYVTVSEATRRGVALPLEYGVEPSLSSLDEAVGCETPWPILHLQVRVRGSQVHVT